MQRLAIFLLSVVFANALLLRADAPARSTLKPRQEHRVVETEMDAPEIPMFDDGEEPAADEELQMPAVAAQREADADSDKRSYMRFGRSYMRFGRSADAKRSSNNAEMEADAADDKRTGGSNVRTQKAGSYMRFGKRSYMRFGK